MTFIEMSATILFTHDPLCFKCCSFKEELWYFETWAYINVHFCVNYSYLRKILGSVQQMEATPDIRITSPESPEVVTQVYDTITESSTLKSLQRGGVTVVTVSRLSKIS